MRTRLPLSLYFTIIATTLVGIIMYSIHLQKTIFYTIFTFVYLYIFLSRYAGVIRITEDTLTVKYFNPLVKDVSIKIDSIVEIASKKGFYDLFANETLGGAFVFPLYCYDRITCKVQTNEMPEIINININTRLFEFDRAVKYLKNLLHGV